MMAACTVGEPHAQLITSLFPPLAPIASFAHHTPTPIHIQDHHHHPPHPHPHAHPPHHPHPHGQIHIPLQEPPSAHIPVPVATQRPPVQVQISTHAPTHAPAHAPPPHIQIKDVPPTTSAPSSNAGVGAAAKSPGGGGHETSDMRTLYVGNLDAGASEELLMAVFSHIGPVRSVKLIHEEETSQKEESGNDPYCFVEFADRQSAEHALHTMNKRLCLGKVK
ncbi:polyadenylate-binding protein 1-B-like isoform X2 [Penaeus vannamei]|uniref:polyadenylate-binding protein 1-B-like isoform X2 n=1 Tax=Penaeus vannamei TaxID=6689 RepID=UPI00387FAA67